MDDRSDILTRIKEKSAVLNQKADEAADILKEIEDDLLDSKPGVDAWLDDPVVSGLAIGYSRVGKTWCFSVKRGEGDAVNLLVNGSRVERILAVKNMDILLAKIESELDARSR